MDDTQLNRLLTPRDKWAESPELLDAMLERVATNAAEQHARPPRRRRGARIAATVGALLSVGVLATAWDGFSLAEAAKILGKKPATVRSRYSRARAKLRADLTANVMP
ncbi:RNA polymerase sigma factor [Microbacterium sp. SA39]|uniref:RNA polymerase sigma factor n=1 Tax=Microbacterium sp. SA39 TaxID=1263625 RepID=UPI0005FA1C36|nr:sigma factor-like helix-turn-helix DNA-binding protein [Microbacterium sp. SA39]KJQ55265.1 RNA polymerase sigma factor [Microbacterium sp. SA39]